MPFLIINPALIYMVQSNTNIVNTSRLKCSVAFKL